jgi:hypothetical protein
MGMSDTWDYYPDRDTTPYRFTVPTEDWEEWKRTIPRTVPLYERLYALIQIDTALDGEANVASLNLLRMKLERIQQRAETAQHALEDGDGPKARAECEQIQDIAGDLLG